MAQAAVQGQLPQEQGVTQVCGDLSGREQDRHGDGKVIGGALFLEVRWGQIDGETAARKLAAGVPDRSPDPLPGLLDGGVRQAHDGKRRQALGDIDLHLHGGPFEADQSKCADFSQHAGMVAKPRRMGKERCHNGVRFSPSGPQ